MFERGNYTIEEIKGAFPVIGGSMFLKILNL
jgi:hypothetical protein